MAASGHGRAHYIPAIAIDTALDSRPTSSSAVSLADTADAITMARFRARDLVVHTKPDITPVTEADHAVEEAVRDRLAPGPARRRVLGEEFGVTGGGRAALDHRPDRRHEVVPARLAAVGHAARARGRRRARARRRVGPALGRRWWATRGGGAFAQRRAHPRVGRRRRSTTRCCATPTCSRTRSSAAGREFDALDRAGVGPARLRRLLGPHARGRGRGRRDVRAGRSTSGTSRAAPDRRGGGRPRHRPAGRARAPTAATPSPRTGSCTTRCSRIVARAAPT